MHLEAKFGQLGVSKNKNGTLGSPTGGQEGLLVHLGATMGTKDLQRRGLEVVQGGPREAIRALGLAKGRPRGANGPQRWIKTGPMWAKGGQDDPSRAPKWIQTGSKTNFAMVKIQNVKMSKKKLWFFHSKWLGSQPRTSQNIYLRAHSGQMAGPVAGQRLQMARQVAGQVVSRAQGRVLAHQVAG